MANNSITLLTTRFQSNDFCYEDYLEFCEMNNIEPKGEDSADYYEWMQEETSINFECDCDNISSVEKYQLATFLISGSLGLWNGRPTIQPITKIGLMDAIAECYSGCDDCEVTLEDGIIYVNGYHHDGCNSLEIRLLKEECIEDAEEWLEEHGDYKDEWFEPITNPYSIL